MVHDVLEIDIALLPFVLLDMKVCFWIVDEVDCMLPSMSVVVLGQEFIAMKISSGLDSLW